MKYVISSTHRNAREWAMRQGWVITEYKTKTDALGADPLRGLSKDEEIYVVDTALPFRDSHKLLDTLLKFNNVQHRRL